MQFEICPKLALRRLGGIALLLLVANVFGLVLRLGFGRDQVYGLVPLFDFDTEKNVPTLFSSLILAVASALLLFIGALHKRRAGHYRCWRCLAGVFLFLSIDETAMIHERLSGVAHRLFGSTFLFSFGWMIFYKIALLLFLVCFARFIWQLPRRSKIHFIGSGLIFVAGAMGCEVLGGREQEIFGDSSPLRKAALYTLEESLEMAGVLFFIFGLLSYIRNNLGKMSIIVGSKA